MKSIRLINSRSVSNPLVSLRHGSRYTSVSYSHNRPPYQTNKKSTSPLTTSNLHSHNLTELRKEKSENEDGDCQMDARMHKRRPAAARFTGIEKFKASLPVMSKMGVYVTQMEMNDPSVDIESVLEFKIENQTKHLTLSPRLESPEMLVFDVLRMRSAVLRIRLLLGAACYTAECHGSVTIPLNLYANGIGSRETEWYSLKKKDRLIGRIEIKLISHTERYQRPLKLLCCTWNMGNAKPTEALTPWLQINDDEPIDLIAVAVQESLYKERSRESSEVVLTQQNVESAPTKQNVLLDKNHLNRFKSFSKTFKQLTGIEQENRANWEDIVRKEVGSEYAIVKSVVMWQMRLLILAHVDIYPTIDTIRTATQATGVGGVGLNKGGVAISLKVWDTHLCFVNAHLAAHQDRVKGRNSMYRTLLRGLRIDGCGMDILTAFHHVFWMGDLNYRINCTESDIPSEVTFNDLVAQCQSGDLKPLLARDQLKLQMNQNLAFQGFQEGEINFMPTYKVERTLGCVYQSKRLPAWCDRILWKSVFTSKPAAVTSYYSVPEITSSDHKPVAALFSVPTVFYNYDQDDAVIVLAIKKLKAERLFMIKKHATRDPSPPNPQAQGTKGRMNKTSVVYKNRDPVWRNACRIKVKEPTLTGLSNYRLFFRVVNRGIGIKGSVQTMGRGVLPLDTINTFTNAKRLSFTFNVQLQYHSMPAGTLLGDIKISLKKRRQRINVTEE